VQRSSRVSQHQGSASACLIPGGLAASGAPQVGLLPGGGWGPDDSSRSSRGATSC
jgi:hypothetical protein